MFDISQLKRIRVALNLTQAQLAKHAGVSQSLVTKIESNSIDPKHSTVVKLGDAISRLERAEQPTVALVMKRTIISATVHEKAPLVIARMQRAGISQVPVFDGKHLAGLVTESSVLDAIAAGKDVHALTAEQLMEDAPPIIPSSTPIATATRLLEHVPIVLVREKSTLAGLVSRSDVIRAKL